MVRSGLTAKSLRLPRRHPAQNPHLNHTMSMTLLRAHPALLLAACTLLFAGIAFAQDKPDRPPWAQKPKSTSASTSTKAPASSPTEEPGKIVQPTPPASTSDSHNPP